MMAISLYYWNDAPNFGDQLNEDICRMITGINPIWASPKRCRAVFIGSVLDKFIYGRNHWTIDALWIKYFRGKVDVWGGGFIKPPTKNNERLMRKLNVHAVRGTLSLDRLRHLTGKTLCGITIGDPGLLASKLLPVDSVTKHCCGIIPHHAELMNIQRSDAIVKIERERGILEHATVRAIPHFWRLIETVPNAVVLNPESRPETIIKRISECGTILSSAMHGLIVADSFAIPNIRIVASDLIMGGDYKFNDYYSVFSRDRHRRLDIRSEIPSGVLEYVKNGYVNPFKDVRKIQNDLIQSFPR